MEPSKISRRSFLKSAVLTASAAALAARAPSAAALAAPTPPAAPAIPRQETLYFGGLQYLPINGWNPYSSNMNNTLALVSGSSARIPVFETPYMYNMLDGQVTPLLADGPFTWNAAHTEITFHLKAAAKWRAGSAVTADDVAYTWATHLKYNTNVGSSYKDFIDSITALDPHTVKVTAKVDGTGKAVNPLMVSGYLSDNYVVQKAWTQILEARSADAAAFLADPAADFVSSGPYYNHYADSEIVILVRDDSYWGKDASMWGKLPVPKYLAHTIFSDNDASLAAFKAGTVDITAQFITSVQNLWLVDHLPIATYLPAAPYMLCASLPTMYYNLKSNGLDQVAVRKAIAMAVDYNVIIASAMSNQSPTFTQVPRSVMNPSGGEQALYDHAAVASLQWAGGDIEGAKALLDAAGIVDTNHDGWREYNGQKLSYNVCCPNGWYDWMSAVNQVAAVGSQIGIELTPLFPEWNDYMNVFTNGNQTAYNLFMVWSLGAGPTNPWARVRQFMSSEYAGTTGNWSGNWGGYRSAIVDAVIAAIPTETDPAALKELYTTAVRRYLTDVPSFTLMYRPDQFYTVNKTVWNNYPHAGDGRNIPPHLLINGYSIAGLYDLTLTQHAYVPAVHRP